MGGKKRANRASAVCLATSAKAGIYTNRIKAADRPWEDQNKHDMVTCAICSLPDVIKGKN